MDPLQGFGFRESQYERPNRDWQCGRACEGRPCHIGPSSRGDCLSHEECLPFRDGDGFKCGRPVEWGGPCENGPFPDGRCCEPIPPCQPTPSLLAKRGRLVFVVVAASLGIGLTMLGSAPSTPQVVNPGPLTAKHQFLEQDCRTCHRAADDVRAVGDDATARADMALVGHHSEELSVRCLVCHDELGPHAMHPHGVAPDRLAEATRRAAERRTGSEPLLLAIAELGPGVPTREDGTLDCATCHHEHRGRQHDLKRMTNLQCQICHTNPFHSLDVGHPDFGDFPHEKRTNIYFDHARHIDGYFKTERTVPTGWNSGRCADCHVLDSDEGTMRTLGFERMCAECHEPSIVDAGYPGIPFVALPHPSDAVIEQVGVGEWPKVGPTTVRRNEQLPPFMEMLLDGDPKYRAAVATLGDFSASDLDLVATEHPEAVRDYLLSVKQLFADVARDGESAVAKRLEGTPLAKDESHASVIVFPMLAAQRRWFPNLLDEAAPAKDEPPPADDAEPEPAEAAAAPADADADPMEAAAGEPVAPEPGPFGPLEGTFAVEGWRVDNAALTIRYRPAGHADTFLRAWLDATVRLGTDNADRGAEERFVADAARQYELLVDPVASGLNGTAQPIASGRCLSCHSVTRDAAGHPVVNWHLAKTGASAVRFTEFSHSPHVRSVLGQKCDECHTLDKRTIPETFRPEFFERDSATAKWRPVPVGTGLSSGFTAVERTTCAKCHKRNRAKQDCLQCHRYHIGHAK